MAVSGDYISPTLNADGTVGSLYIAVTGSGSATGFCNGIGGNFAPNAGIEVTSSSPDFVADAYYQDMAGSPIPYTTVIPWPTDHVDFAGWGAYPACMTSTSSGDGGNNGGGGGGNECGDDGAQCSSDGDCCSGTCNGDTCGDVDPLVVDLSGAGYALTSKAAGVEFDFFGKGKKVQIPWTAPNSRTGWLALDREGSGEIHNGSDLFSNVAPQPAARGKAKLGFRALALYDEAAYGGNSDGVIDSKDAVFTTLLVWVDSNHNGIADPGELLTMEQAGIESISLQYEPSHWTDAFGNRFGSRSRIVFAGYSGSAERYVYDVTLGARNGLAVQ